jgi:hypothetical protein
MSHWTPPAQPLDDGTLRNGGGATRNHMHYKVSNEADWDEVMKDEFEHHLFQLLAQIEKDRQDAGI